MYVFGLRNWGLVQLVDVWWFGVGWGLWFDYFRDCVNSVGDLYYGCCMHLASLCIFAVLLMGGFGICGLL